MSDSEPALDFDFKQLVKSIRAIELKNLQSAEEFKTATSSVEEIKKELAAARAKCEDEDFQTRQLKTETDLLEDKIPRKKASIDALAKQIEDIRVTIEDVKWRQTKAKVVLESERGRVQLYRRIMERRIAEDAPKTEPEVDCASGSQISAAHAERALKKEELLKRKEYLQTEISNMQTILEGKDKVMSDLGSEASVLKKRNSAVLLRLRRKLQESEARRRGMVTSIEELREMEKRARPPF